MGTVDKLNQLQSRRNAIALGGGEEKIKKQHAVRPGQHGGVYGGTVSQGL